MCIRDRTDPTLAPDSGLWTYGINSANGLPTAGIFSFQSNNEAVASVPDHGGTIILLGLGMLGLIGASRTSKRGSFPRWLAA